MRNLLALFLMVFAATSPSWAVSGQKVFETYCWGCHHQTAMAFGPPFAQIASQRDAATIRAMISDPESVSRTLGYRRNAMPKLPLREEELQAITAYILSYKPQTAESNTPKAVK